MLLTAPPAFIGTTDEMLDDPVLAITVGRIIDVGSRRDLPIGAEVVDLGDVTLLPGLIDVHQHLAFDASTGPVAQLQIDDDAALLERMRHHALRALGAGVTTVRDLGARGYLSLELRNRFAGTEIGPRIVASGPPSPPRTGTHLSLGECQHVASVEFARCTCCGFDDDRREVPVERLSYGCPPGCVVAPGRFGIVCRNGGHEFGRAVEAFEIGEHEHQRPQRVPLLGPVPGSPPLLDEGLIACQGEVWSAGPGMKRRERQLGDAGHEGGAYGLRQTHRFLEVSESERGVLVGEQLG